VPHPAGLGSRLGGEKEVGSSEQLDRMPGAGVALALGWKSEIRHLSLRSVRPQCKAFWTSNALLLSAPDFFLYLDL
jgi:hypothetical protein